MLGGISLSSQQNVKVEFYRRHFRLNDFVTQMLLLLFNDMLLQNQIVHLRLFLYKHHHLGICCTTICMASWPQVSRPQVFWPDADLNAFVASSKLGTGLPHLSFAFSRLAQALLFQDLLFQDLLFQDLLKLWRRWRTARFVGVKESCWC